MALQTQQFLSGNIPLFRQTKRAKFVHYQSWSFVHTLKETEIARIIKTLPSVLLGHLVVAYVADEKESNLARLHDHCEKGKARPASLVA
ncbi:MAG: hypothetical protein NVSMB27_33950 [Ktedonobacteraceae bacterium]